MPFAMKKDLQNATQNNCKALIANKEGLLDTISNWVEAYFLFEVNTSASSQKVQRRDLTPFISHPRPIGMRIEKVPPLQREHISLYQTLSMPVAFEWM